MSIATMAGIFAIGCGAVGLVIAIILLITELKR